MEETKEVTTSLKSRRLKRKSEERSIIDSSRGVNSLQDRSSPKLRKYSRRLPPTDNEHCTVDNNTNKIDTKENALLSSRQSPEYALKPSKGKTTRNRSRSKDRKKPLVPRLDSLNEDREFSECATGFILSPRAERPYKCHFCVKQFKYFSNLKSHMNVVHKKKIDKSPTDMKTSTVGNGQVFQCEICFRNFKYFSNLRTHRLVHTNNELEAGNSD